MAVLSVILGSLAAASVVAGAPSSSPQSPQQYHNQYQRQNQHRSSSHYIVPRAPAVALAEHTLPLTRHVRPAGANGRPRPWFQSQNQPQNRARSYSPHHPRDGSAPNGTAGAAGPVSVGHAVASNHDIEYLTNVQAGKNNLSLIVDTGSSDTWFVHQGFVCIDPQFRQPTLASNCDFGPPFKGDFPGGQIVDQHLSVAYGSGGGPFITGEVGYSDLTVSSLVTRKQLIGLATRGAWNGDGISSGILGLGLPGLTNAFPGTEPNTVTDGLRPAVLYDPLVTTLGAQNVTQFSLALSRDEADSFLAFGGAPPNVPIDTELGWATTPMTKLSGLTAEPSYLYYTIDVNSMTWNSSQLTRSTKALPAFIVDSGTTLNLFPYDIAQSVNSMFVPHAQYDPDQQAFFVRCDAKPPSFGIEIGGKMLWTDPASMILPPSRGLETTGMCMTGIAPTTSFPYILGDVFMQQLVTVFDVSAKEIKFAKRLPKAGGAAAAPVPAPTTVARPKPTSTPKPTKAAPVF